MTKQEIKAKLEHQLAEAIEGASHFGNSAEGTPFDFLIDKLADLQLQIQELRKECVLDPYPDGCGPDCSPSAEDDFND